MAALDEALHFVRMSGLFYCRSELRAPWGIALPGAKHCASFHVVTSGRCWLIVDDERRELETGDLVVVRHGGACLVDDPSTPAEPFSSFAHEHVSGRYGILRVDGGIGASTTLVCGAVSFDDPASKQLVEMLPRVIYVSGRRPERMEWLDGMLRFMAFEARESRAGGETIITRLADILVIQAIRTWLEDDATSRGGWLGALRDAQIGRAIARIHRDPAHPWTLALLAGEASMSRSAFAARFTELVGEPAMQYVTRWRMHVAATWLRDDTMRAAEVAKRLGYRSEASFNRAFKRVMGLPPGQQRRSSS
jgi:AraC-like DNA-binding protein